MIPNDDVPTSGAPPDVIVAHRSIKLLAMSLLLFPIGAAFGIGGVMGVATMLTESRLDAVLVGFGMFLPSLPIAGVLLHSSIICWFDFFRRGPLLRLEEERVFDYRQSPRPIDFSDVERAKISHSRGGPMAMTLWLRPDAANSMPRINAFRIGCWSMLSCRNDRRVCISIGWLDQSPHSLSEQFTERLRHAGITIETRSKYNVLAEA